MMRIEELTDPEHPACLTFFEECKRHGFENNVSAKAIKFHWAVNERMGKFWSLFVAHRMIAMAGCHWLPEVSERAFRIQFRGCELPGTDVKKTLSRSQFNSSTFRELIPLQLAWIRKHGEFDAYITTNHNNRNHRAMELIARQGFLSPAKEGPFFGVHQTVWRFHSDRYLDVRSRIRSYAQ